MDLSDVVGPGSDPEGEGVVRDSPILDGGVRHRKGSSG